jgi:hypothetical protein
VINATPRLLYPLETNPVHIVTKLVKVKFSRNKSMQHNKDRVVSSLPLKETPWYSILLEAEWTLRLLNAAEGRGHLNISKELTRN